MRAGLIVWIFGLFVTAASAQEIPPYDLKGDELLMNRAANLFVVINFLNVDGQPKLYVIDNRTEKIVSPNFGEGRIVYVRRSSTQPCVFALLRDQNDTSSVIRVLDFTYLSDRWFSRGNEIFFIGDGVHPTYCEYFAAGPICHPSISQPGLPDAGQRMAIDMVADIQANGCPAAAPLKYYYE